MSIKTMVIYYILLPGPDHRLSDDPLHRQDSQRPDKYLFTVGSSLRSSPPIRSVSNWGYSSPLNLKLITLAVAIGS